MARANGGVIGAYVNTTSLLAAGRWGLNDGAVRSSRINTGGVVDVWPTLADANFASVVGLYHFDAITTAGLHQDSSSKALSLGLGNASTNTPLSFGTFKFGPSALQCSGSAGYASHATDANYNFGTSDFCVEGWFYPNVLATAALWDMRSGTGTQRAAQVYTLTDGSLHYFSQGADGIASAASVIAINGWYHVAAARVSNTTRLFVNGTQVGSNYSDNNTYNQGALVIGAASNVLSPFNCFVDDFRITNGAGRYSSNFTAPTAPFPDH